MGKHGNKRGKKHFPKQKKFKPEGGRTQKKPNEWQDWDPIVCENAALEQYYKDQKICEDDFEAMMEALKKPLPAAIRLNQNGAGFAKLQEVVTSLEAPFKPVPLKWFPCPNEGDVAFQWESLDRKTIRKEPRLSAFKKFLTREEGRGGLTRQETVSMVPPLFLDVQPDHLVLDMCAAPGSKTSQILEIMGRQNDGQAKGMVLANDVEWKRAHMLAHQVQRVASPSTAVVNTDAQFFPSLRTKDGPLLFDRVLCDVPCSGDGTLRKQPAIWKNWARPQTLALHFRQWNILNRGLTMLKPGGRLVYSTCALNPIEDEAVIAGALAKNKNVRLIPPPADLEAKGLKGRPGLTQWKVPAEEGDGYVEKFEDLPKDRKTKVMVPTMWPPTDESILSQLPLSRRFVPQDMNTGGFFVAIFEKVAEAPVPEAGGQWMAISKEFEAPYANKDSEQFKEDCQEYEQVRDFYGLPADYPLDQLFRRCVNEKAKGTLYMSTTGVQTFFNCEMKASIRAVHVGVRVFQRADNYHCLELPWRLCQEGIRSLDPLMSKRKLTISKAHMERLLETRDLPIAELPAPGLPEHMFWDHPERGRIVRPGGVIVALEEGHLDDRFLVSCILTPHTLQVFVEKNELAALKVVLAGGEDVVAEMAAAADLALKADATNADAVAEKADEMEVEAAQDEEMPPSAEEATAASA